MKDEQVLIIEFPSELSFFFKLTCLLLCYLILLPGLLLLAIRVDPLDDLFVVDREVELLYADPLSLVVEGQVFESLGVEEVVVGSIMVLYF